MELTMVFCSVLFSKRFPVLKQKHPASLNPSLNLTSHTLMCFFLMAISTCGFSDALGLPYPTRITKRHHEESMGISLDVPTRLVASRVLAQLGWVSA